MSNKQQKPGRVKAAVLSWLGLNSAYQGPDEWATRSDAGVVVNADAALKLPTLWACTRVVSQTVASFPLAVFEQSPGSAPVAKPNLPVARIVSSQPNADMTSVMFWESMISQALLWGNSFAEKKFIDGRLVALEPLQSERTTWRRLPDGSYEYTYVEFDGSRRNLMDDDVFHLPGFSFTGKFGLSVIRYGANLFGSSLAAEQVASATFKNGLMPTTYIKFDEFVKQDQREQFREQIEKFVGSMNAGKVPVLEGGMETGEIGINPSDAQLLESRNFSASQICQWFGVPPPIVGITDKASSWASSSEQMNLWFLQYGLLPWIKRIESAIWQQLFTPAQQARHYAEFKYEGLLRADTAAKVSFYSAALQNGWMNRSTVASIENLPEIPGGDVFTVQSNLVPLESLGSPASESEQLRSALSQFLSSSGVSDEE